MNDFRRSLTALIRPHVPVTARQTYYMAVAAGVCPKTENSYRRTLRVLGQAREVGSMPWEWIADNTRWVRQAETHSDLASALDDMQRHYRRDYWRDQPWRVEVWVESDSIASFISGTTHQMGVPLYVCKGQASKSYIKNAADTSQRLGKPVQVLYVGDWDPTGVAIDVSVDDRYRRYAPDAELHIQRIAVTPDLIRDLRLADHPAKPSDPNYRKFAARCEEEGLQATAVETEALPPDVLRQLVLDAVMGYVDRTLARFVAGFGDAT
jgi:hypothetical protein